MSASVPVERQSSFVSGVGGDAPSICVASASPSAALPSDAALSTPADSAAPSSSSTCVCVHGSSLCSSARGAPAPSAAGTAARTAAMHGRKREKGSSAASASWFHEIGAACVVCVCAPFPHGQLSPASPMAPQRSQSMQLLGALLCGGAVALAGDCHEAGAGCVPCVPGGSGVPCVPCVPGGSCVPCVPGMPWRAVGASAAAGGADDGAASRKTCGKAGSVGRGAAGGAASGGSGGSGVKIMIGAVACDLRSFCDVPWLKPSPATRSRGGGGMSPLDADRASSSSTQKGLPASILGVPWPVAGTDPPALRARRRLGGGKVIFSLPGRRQGGGGVVGWWREGGTSHRSAAGPRAPVVRDRGS